MPAAIHVTKPEPSQAGLAIRPATRSAPPGALHHGARDQPDVRELIGLWVAAAWRAMGSPEHVRLVEPGPASGTMMLDALRAAKVMPDFRSVVVVHFVEINPVLERLQRQAWDAADLPVSYATLGKCRMAR